MRIAALAALEHRLATLAPRAMPFGLVLGHLQRHEAIEVRMRGLAERDVVSRVDRFLRDARGERRQRRDVLRDLARLRHQLAMRNHPLRETDAIGLVSLERETHREA